MVLVFFLLANGLFLWIIPGGYHIPASGLADMQAFFTLAPLLYLAQPVGHIDAGGITGSYIGLIFLSGIYVAAGGWASALTENQIIVFLYTLVVAFGLYTGLDFIADILLFEDYQTSAIR